MQKAYYSNFYEFSCNVLYNKYFADLEGVEQHNLPNPYDTNLKSQLWMG